MVLNLSISKEHDFLLQSVKRWFNRPDQISYYYDEVSGGLTEAEQYLLNNLPNNGSILDVGCGAGRISMYLAEKGYMVTGVDISEGLITRARELSTKKNLTINFINTEGLDLPFKDATFEIMVGFKVLCYIPSRKLRHEYLQELFRVLKPGGTLIMTQNTVPEEYIDEAKDEFFESCPASQFMILEPGDNFPLGDGYVRWFTERELLDEIKKTDFVVEVFDSDEAHNGAGFLKLIRLKKFC
ncbi:class I SAM-dependent methyltransferase [Paenibacillus harenae]|uniref:class I SAM-dependent methyltransferase n=1 Tax=Paenibacillus harenae TaxID=306543 RepID=UPI0027912D96|nr:class I SAM-dependent methyltransferase [Paenibacillus harenae]MDQ0060002.1 ubiquinone/menaquinone biosynthesis C-methylase UbiE [Paenibacillus harenae]